MPSAVEPIELSIFQQQLIGTWTNQNLPGTSKGGPESPYSYNVMPLPQNSPQSPSQNLGYILKCFTYYETIRFNAASADAVAVPGKAPNRGGDYQQTPFALFYDQQVKFAEGPTKDTIVHLENGLWLHLQSQAQQIGPYILNPPVNEPGPVPPQPADRTLAKQISIPHGNSVLAMGAFSEGDGVPTIPDGPPVLPMPASIGTEPYVQQLDDPLNYQNPQPNLASNVSSQLQAAIADLAAAGTPVNKFIAATVDTRVYGGVLNIPFEERKAKLDYYAAQYWLLSIDNGVTFDILAYVQNIVLILPINGVNYVFPHPTANVVSRVK